MARGNGKGINYDNDKLSADRPLDYRDFYEPYLDFVGDVSDDGWIHCLCPFHEDSHPSAGINIKSGVFNCFAQCGQISPAKFLERTLKIEPIEAFRKVDAFRQLAPELTERIATFIPHRTASPKFARLHVRSLELIGPELPIVKDYLLSKGLKYETLVKAKIGYLPAAETSWKRDSLVFAYHHNGEVVGIRYRSENSDKGGEPGCYFTMWGVDELNQYTNQVVVLAEGETDRLRTMQELGDEYIVLGTPTATFRREWVRELEGVRRIILIPQSDGAADKMVAATLRYIPDVTILNLPWKRGQVGKDTTQWLGYHNGNDLKSLVDTVAEQSSQGLMTMPEFREMSNKPKVALIENFIYERQLGIVAGQPKAKKTWAALNIARALLLKEPLFDIPTLSVPEDTATPNILLIEEEGNERELMDRITMVLGDVPAAERHLFIRHYDGLKLDQQAWIEKLDQDIEKHNINLILIDPFQATHGQDEDSASEMNAVWNNLKTLLAKYKHLCIIIVHHFNKQGSIEGGFNSFRGSSLTAASVDVAMFMEPLPAKQGGGARVKFDGRIPPVLDAAGRDIFSLSFTNGIMRANVGAVTAKSKGHLVDVVDAAGGSIFFEEACRILNCSQKALRNMVKEFSDELELDTTMDGDRIRIIQ